MDSAAVVSAGADSGARCTALVAAKQEVRADALKGLCFTCEAAPNTLAAVDAGREDDAVQHAILWVQGMFHCRRSGHDETGRRR